MSKDTTPVQKLKDFITLLKNERKYQAIAIVLGIFVAWGVFGSGAAPRRGPGKQVSGTPIKDGSGALDGDEHYKDLLNRFDTDLAFIKQKSIENNTQIQTQQQHMEQFEERTAEIFKRFMTRFSEIEGAVQNAGSQGPAGAQAAAVAGEQLTDTQDDGMTTFGDMDAQEVAPPAPIAPKKIAVVGIGDSVRVKMLAGVDAPTDGTPYPVVFKLIGDVDGPDGQALSLGEARIVAAAQGSLSDNRALFRLNNINLRYPDGSRRVHNIDGWIVGEDGIRGMEGVLIDPIGKALAGSFMSGMVEGLGAGVQAGNTLNTMNSVGQSFSYVNGDVGEYALGAGLGKAGERWGKFIDSRAALLVPHIRVYSGREATAVFTKNLELDGLYEQIEDEELQLVSLD